MRFSLDVLTREELNFIPVDAALNSFEYIYLKIISAGSIATVLTAPELSLPVMRANRRFRELPLALHL